MTISADAQTTAPRPPRILLIDTLRGIALIAMASYHLTWDLEFFGYLDPGTATDGWFRIYARTIASSFLFLAGVSLVLAHGSGIRWPSFWKRFAIVAGAAAAISLATYVAFPQEWIYFGILHNIALSSVIGLAFLRMPLVPAIVIPVLIAAAMIVNAVVMPGILQSSAFDARWLSWLGFADLPPRSNDYVPLFPWLAALLAGVVITRIALARGWDRRLAGVQHNDTLLAKAGRHSLIVYLVHQPVLIGLVGLFSLVHPADMKENYSRICTGQMTSQGYAEDLSQKYCGCVADQLTQKSLLEPLMSNTLAENDEGLQSIIRQCSASTP